MVPLAGLEPATSRVRSAWGRGSVKSMEVHRLWSAVDRDCRGPPCTRTDGRSWPPRWHHARGFVDTTLAGGSRLHVVIPDITKGVPLTCGGPLIKSLSSELPSRRCSLLVSASHAPADYLRTAARQLPQAVKASPRASAGDAARVSGVLEHSLSVQRIDSTFVASAQHPRPNPALRAFPDECTQQNQAISAIFWISALDLEAPSTLGHLVDREVVK